MNTWPEWTDVLGQTYRPGDRVAIAIISGRSPQLVIGTVLQINRVDSKGEEIRKACFKRFERDDGKWDYERWTEDSCTVRVRPELDARGFYRSNRGWFDDKHNEARPVTYKIPENIIKVADG